jgi:hypothetical protein
MRALLKTPFWAGTPPSARRHRGRQEKTRRETGPRQRQLSVLAISALPSFHARVFLVNDVHAAFAAHDAAVFVTFFGGFQRAKDFHNYLAIINERRLRGVCVGAARLSTREEDPSLFCIRLTDVIETSFAL